MVVESRCDLLKRSEDFNKSHYASSMRKVNLISLTPQSLDDISIQSSEEVVMVFHFTGAFRCFQEDQLFVERQGDSVMGVLLRPYNRKPPPCLKEACTNHFPPPPKPPVDLEETLRGLFSIKRKRTRTPQADSPISATTVPAAIQNNFIYIFITRKSNLEPPRSCTSTPLPWFN